MILLQADLAGEMVYIPQQAVLERLWDGRPRTAVVATWVLTIRIWNRING